MDRPIFTQEQCEEAVKGHLQAFADLRALLRHNKPDLQIAQTLEELILERGRPFTRRGALPKNFPVTPRSRECYFNAWKLYKRLRNHKYRYCEGYVMAESFIIPVLHGWLIDSETNELLDPSVEQEGAIYYHGVVFRRDFTDWVWPMLRRRQAIGILGNVWQLRDLSTEELLNGIEPQS